jgi:hypothetical protein
MIYKSIAKLRGNSSQVWRIWCFFCWDDVVVRSVRQNMGSLYRDLGIFIRKMWQPWFVTTQIAHLGGCKCIILLLLSNFHEKNTEISVYRYPLIFSLTADGDWFDLGGVFFFFFKQYYHEWWNNALSYAKCFRELRGELILLSFFYQKC